MNTTTNTRGVSEVMYTPEQIEAAFEQWENDASVISLFAAFEAGVAYAAALSAPEPAAQQAPCDPAKCHSIQENRDYWYGVAEQYRQELYDAKQALAEPAAQGEADGWPVLAEELSKTFSAEIYDLFADADEITQSSVVNALERAIKKHCKFPVADLDDYDLDGVLLTIEQRQKVVKEAMAFIDGKPAAWRCRYFDKETGVGFWRYSVGEPQRSHQTGNMGFEKEALYTAPPAQPAERVPDGCIPIHRTLLDKLATDMDAIDMPKIGAAIRRWVAAYDAKQTASPAPSEGKGVDRG